MVGATIADSPESSILKPMALIFGLDKDGNTRPEIRCDSCGGVIENYADGFATIDASAATPGTVLEPIFRCAGCENEAQRTGKHRRSMRIDTFMLYLLNNIQLTPNVLEEAGRKMKDFDA
jgi:hypothetical protein